MMVCCHFVFGCIMGFVFMTLGQKHAQRYILQKSHEGDIPNFFKQLFKGIIWVFIFSDLKTVSRKPNYIQHFKYTSHHLTVFDNFQQQAKTNQTNDSGCAVYSLKIPEFRMDLDNMATLE